MKQKLKLRNMAAALITCIAVCIMLVGSGANSGGDSSYKIKMTTKANRVEFYLQIVSYDERTIENSKTWRNYWIRD